MPDSGAAGILTAGELQLRALQKLLPSIQLDTTSAGQQKVRFGKGNDVSLGTVVVPTPLGNITFYVVPAGTLFLYCI